MTSISTTSSLYGIMWVLSCVGDGGRGACSLRGFGGNEYLKIYLTSIHSAVISSRKYFSDKGLAVTAEIYGT